MADHLRDTVDKIRSGQTEKQTDQVWKEGYILAALLPLRPFYSSHEVVQQASDHALSSLLQLAKASLLLSSWDWEWSVICSRLHWELERQTQVQLHEASPSPCSWHDAPLPNQGSADGAKEESMVRERSPRPAWAIQHGPVSKVKQQTPNTFEKRWQKDFRQTCWNE